MNNLITKILGVAVLVVGEVQEDLKDGKITIGEILDATKDIVIKLGYADKTIFQLKSANDKK